MANRPNNQLFMETLICTAVILMSHRRPSLVLQFMGRTGEHCKYFKLQTKISYIKYYE